MPERSSLLQGVQIGVETVPGTGVAASKFLQSLGFMLKPEIETQRFQPAGSKVDTLVTPSKDYASASLVGQGTYDEIVYALSSILCTSATVTTTGTTGKLWTFTPLWNAEDTPKTFTIEQGGAIRAQKVTGAIITDFGVKVSRDVTDLSGTILAQAFADGITLTAAPTAVPLVPILPKHFSVCIDTTGAALGTTKMLRLFESELKIGNRYGAVWPLNSALASYAATVETKSDWTLRLLLEADAAGMALLTTMRAGSTAFVRTEAVGDVIGAGPATCKYTQDTAIKFESIDKLDDTNGIYTLEITGRLVYDAVWAKFLQIAVINSTAAL
jgi:hypothetical protein